jgi:hypothetical protein
MAGEIPMSSLKTIIDELSKQKLLIYFLILWGASMFLYAICNLGSGGLGIVDVYDALWILANLFDLAAGIFLMLFAIKLLSPNFLAGLQTEKTLVIFLLLWAGQFFFWGLSDLLYYEGIVCILAALVYWIAGIVLAMSAWKFLNEKGTTAPIQR